MTSDDTSRRLAWSSANTETSTQRCYGTQVLIAGRSKHWRDSVRCQMRRAGYCTTVVDSGVDALRVLVLGLPVDVLVTDADLYGDLCCARLAREARALRPTLRIVFAGEIADLDVEEPQPGALVVPRGAKDGTVASTVRAAMAMRA